jgi:hypothetical protein
MANYPTSVFNPASRSNGQSIDASHMNDVQGEIAAIEDALINGFAARPIEPPPHMALVYLPSTYTVGSSVSSTLSFRAQAILTNSSAHSTGTNPERLTPQSTGVYLFTAQVSMQVGSSGVRQVDLIDSSGVNLGINRVHTNGTDELSFQVAGYKRFDQLGGYVVVRFIATGQSTLSLSSGVDQNWFSMVKL